MHVLQRNFDVTTVVYKKMNQESVMSSNEIRRNNKGSLLY